MIYRTFFTSQVVQDGFLCCNHGIIAAIMAVSSISSIESSRIHGDTAESLRHPDTLLEDVVRC